MPLEAISTPSAPAAIGPYSQAIKSGTLLFVSGQIPMNPQEDNAIPDGITSQTRQALKNLEAVLQAAGGGLGDVVKTTVYLTDLSFFVKMNDVYAEFFSSHRPARAAVEVSRLPKEVLVEIDAIADIKG